jgi:hypothetical protein
MRFVLGFVVGVIVASALWALFWWLAFKEDDQDFEESNAQVPGSPVRGLDDGWSGDPGMGGQRTFPDHVGDQS